MVFISWICCCSCTWTLKWHLGFSCLILLLGTACLLSETPLKYKYLFMLKSCICQKMWDLFHGVFPMNFCMDWSKSYLLNRTDNCSATLVNSKDIHLWITWKKKVVLKSYWRHEIRELKKQQNSLFVVVVQEFKKSVTQNHNFEVGDLILPSIDDFK